MEKNKFEEIIIKYTENYKRKRSLLNKLEEKIPQIISNQLEIYGIEGITEKEIKEKIKIYKEITGEEQIYSELKKYIEEYLISKNVEEEKRRRIIGGIERRILYLLKTLIK